MLTRFGNRVWYHILILGYHTAISGYHTLKSGYGTGDKIFKINVVQPFPNQLIITMYHFEVNMMVVGGWVFPCYPLKISPFLLALTGYFQNFHMTSQTHITDFL